MHRRLGSSLRRAWISTVWMVGSAALIGCGPERDAQSKPRLAPDAPIPSEFPAGTKLVLGDPTVKKQLQLSGLMAKLPFVADWQNISGGPNTIESFRANALDGGAVGDTPPIHAAFTGLRVKIIAVQMRDRPTYRLGIAPGQRIQSISDLRGKRIAYSPGQAQGALVQRVLKKAGLSASEVKLVQLNSPEFKDALASRQVDVAPLGGTLVLRYLDDYAAAGATVIDHGVRDNLGFFYVRSDVLEDPDRAAALRAYVRLRIAAQRFAVDSPEAWIDAYYVKDQGLTPAQGRYLVEALGRPQYPTDWSEAIAMTQETIDLMAASSGQSRFDANEIFDRRFEDIPQEVAASAVHGESEPVRLTRLEDRQP